MNSFLHSNAQVAAGQKHAIAVTTSAAISSLESIHSRAGMTEETLSRLHEAIVSRFLPRPNPYLNFLEYSHSKCHILRRAPKRTRGDDQEHIIKFLDHG